MRLEVGDATAGEEVTDRDRFKLCEFTSNAMREAGEALRVKLAAVGINAEHVMIEVVHVPSHDAPNEFRLEWRFRVIE